MDANHFRDRAAKAREMARVGDDVRLAEMLLEVAIDLDAEAEAIEAEQRAANLRLVPTPQAAATWLRGKHTLSGDLSTGSTTTVAKRWSAAAPARAAAEPLMVSLTDVRPARA